jgi:hypothetical protein
MVTSASEREIYNKKLKTTLRAHTSLLENSTWTEMLLQLEE